MPLACPDYFYVPTYTSCTILPVYDWVGPGPFTSGFPMRPVTGMRMAYDALQQVRTRWPYFNRSVAARRAAMEGGRPPAPNHLWLFSHDEGACQGHTHTPVPTSHCIECCVRALTALCLVCVCCRRVLGAV